MSSRGSADYGQGFYWPHREFDPDDPALRELDLVDIGPVAPEDLPALYGFLEERGLTPYVQHARRDKRGGELSLRDVFASLLLPKDQVEHARKLIKEHRRRAIRRFEELGRREARLSFRALLVAAPVAAVAGLLGLGFGRFLLFVFAGLFFTARLLFHAWEWWRDRR